MAPICPILSGNPALELFRLVARCTWSELYSARLRSQSSRQQNMRKTLTLQAAITLEWSVEEPQGRGETDSLRNGMKSPDDPWQRMNGGMERLWCTVYPSFKSRDTVQSFRLINRSIVVRVSEKKNPLHNWRTNSPSASVEITKVGERQRYSDSFSSKDSKATCWRVGTDIGEWYKL